VPAFRLRIGWSGWACLHRNAATARVAVPSAKENRARDDLRRPSRGGSCDPDLPRRLGHRGDRELSVAGPAASLCRSCRPRRARRQSDRQTPLPPRVRPASRSSRPAGRLCMTATVLRRRLGGAACGNLRQPPNAAMGRKRTFHCK
jgi:hypothetical protein